MEKILFLLLLVTSFLRPLGAREQWMRFTDKKWDDEYRRGKWDYMETNPVERSRSAAIGGVLSQIHSHPQTHANISVLDVGCGEGAISDFLHWSKNFVYVGVDLSGEVIKRATQKRSRQCAASDDNNNCGSIEFVQSAAHLYVSKRKFDVIVFSEVLYYTEYESIIDQYDEFLSKPNGIVIISIFREHEKLFPKMEAIFKYAREKYEKIDEIDISGFISRIKEGRGKTAFQIEVFRSKS